MLSKRDYFLMADVFREVFLESETTVYMSGERIYREILYKFIVMLQSDNPKFREDYFVTYIKTGRCKPQKSPSGQAQA
jgi:hypothetical protein